MSHHRILKDRINQVLRQWKKLILLKGSAILLLGTLAAFFIAFVLDTMFALDDGLRIVLLLGIIGVFLALLYLQIIRPLLRAPTESQLARYLEEKHPQLEDRLVTAVELGGGQQKNLSQIFQRLLEDTQVHIEPLNFRKSFQSHAAVIWASMAAVVSLILGTFIFSNIDFFALTSNRILTPWKFPTLKTAPQISVSPGDARIPKGSAQEIKAEVSGFETKEAFLYFSNGDTAWDKTEMDLTLKKGEYVYNFFDIRRETKYYIKAGDKLSEIFTFSVYDVPKIKRVDLTYNYPDYTGLPTKKERDTGDVWAPEGTTVTVSALADKPIKKGKLILGEEQNELKATIAKDTVLTASFKITQDSFYKIHITDTDGLTNEPSEYYIHALPNQPPLLTIQKPGRDIKATMVEEVPVRIKLQDDYDIPSLKLLYRVNGSQDREMSLQARPGLENSSQPESPNREFVADHLFYLEDMDVQPGDFLTYFVQAQDNNTEAVTSDIFFVEVRPFEQEFYRPMSQGQGGGGGGMGGRLSETQKEILIATWKLEQRKEKSDITELAQDAEVLTESQKNLQEVTQSTLFQMQQRSILSGESGGDVTKYYSQAVDAMQRALEKLQEQDLKEAQTPQRDALQNLLAAEAQIKEIQIRQAQSQGAGDAATLNELSQLFEEEMDKLKNKYETLDQNLQRKQNEDLNEALQKIKELARRQEEFNRQMRDLAQKPPEEKKRQIEELRREQEDIRRETQEMTRQMQQMQQQNANLPREIQEQLRRATSEMNNASNNLRSDNTELAAAKGTRALDRLNRLEDLLRRNQKESLRRQVEEMEQKFNQLADAQKQLARDVEQLNQEKGDEAEIEEKLRSLRERQGGLKENFDSAQKQMESLSEQANTAKNELSRDINDLSRDLAQNGIKQKMETAEKLLEENRLNSATQAERDIQKELARMGEKLTQLRGQFAESKEEKLDLALSQTRRLRENLESLQQHAEKMKRASAEPGGGAEQNRADTEEAGPGETKQLPQNLDPEKFDWFNEELAKGLKDLSSIQRSIEVDTSLARRAGRINQNYQGVVRTFSGGNKDRWNLLEAQVLDPLKRLEAELSQKVELMKNKEKMFLAREEKIPPKYEEMVEKYYESLSKSK